MTITADTLLDLCDAAVKTALERGASAAEAYAEYADTLTANLEQNDMKAVTSATHAGIGVRVFVGDKLGFATANKLDDITIGTAIDEAILVAKASPADAANALLEPAPLPTVDGLYDPAVAAATADDVAALAMRLLAAARKDPRVSIDTGSVGTAVGHGAIVSSAGVRASASETSFGAGLFGMAIDGDEVGSFDHVDKTHRTLAAADPEALGADFAARVLGQLGPKDGPTYQGPVLFTADAFAEIFLGTVLGALDGDTVFKGKSKLADKRGETISNVPLHLVDDGTVAGAVGSGAFDREGQPHRPLVLLDEGKVGAFMYDGKSALRAGAQSTGHASGGATSLPSAGLTNLSLRAGDMPEADMRKAAGIEVGRFSGNVDAISGDFSGVAKCSYALDEAGNRTHALKETLIAGNVYTLLHSIIGLGDTQVIKSTYRGPPALIDQVTVTGRAG